jgi:hypothetical protein
VGTEVALKVSAGHSQELKASAAAGGPGAGDLIYYVYDVMFAWLGYQGRVVLAPLSYTEAVHTASYIKNHGGDPSKIGISLDSAQLLLALDPFVAGGSSVNLPQGRFQFVATLDYGGGETWTETLTYTSSQTVTHYATTTTSNVEDWTPGLWLNVFIDPIHSQTTVTMTNTETNEQTHTDTVQYSLTTGNDERIVAEVWKDTLFGTYAFRAVAPSAANSFLFGRALDSLGHPRAQQTVTLTVQDRRFMTASDARGNFAFSAFTLPPGEAMLSIAGQSAKPVHIVTPTPAGSGFTPVPADSLVLIQGGTIVSEGPDHIYKLLSGGKVTPSLGLHPQPIPRLWKGALDSIPAKA